MHRLYPRTSVEYEHFAPSGYPAKALFEKRSAIPALQSDALLSSPFPHRSLEDGLIFGDLPGIAAEHGRPETRRDILRTYTSVYIEEELHRETQLRIGAPSCALYPSPLTPAHSSSSGWASNSTNVSPMKKRAHSRIIGQPGEPKSISS